MRIRIKPDPLPTEAQIRRWMQDLQKDLETAAMNRKLRGTAAQQIERLVYRRKAEAEERKRKYTVKLKVRIPRYRFFVHIRPKKKIVLKPKKIRIGG